MLQTLRVRNLAIVEDLRVEFGKGLNVITGETGAGKSILVGALGLVLGERADRGMIRSGAQECGVEAVFQLAGAAGVNAILDGSGISVCQDGLLIVRRTVSASGSGRNFVNDSPATLQVLRGIGDLLVDMHGPHDHQSLLSQDSQTDLLDSFGQLWKIREVYERSYDEMVALERRIQEFEQGGDSPPGEIDALAFQAREIEDAELSEEEEKDLEREHTILANTQRILELADGVRNALTEGDGSSHGGMVSARKGLTALARILPEAAGWEAEAESIAIRIRELSDSLNSSVQNIETDPGRMQWVEDRMALLHKLKRKYGGSVAEILEHLARTKRRLGDLETRGEQVAVLNEQLAAARKSVQSTGQKLGRERRRAAESLAQSVTSELSGLGFARGAFDVALREAPAGRTGLDDVEFGFAPNVGEPMRPLRTIASSGEISRVMLATKAVLSSHDRIPVLVFDEIDVNIGGEMANTVGAKLAALGRDRQVLCITHLPQVAVHGSSHFVVTKSVRDGRTRAEIRPVEENERVEEVARMLGGSSLTSVATKHAREMLANIRRG